MKGWVYVYVMSRRTHSEFVVVDTKLACDFLERWPSLEELQQVRSGEVKKFFRHRRGRHGELTEWRMEGISQAMPAIRDGR